MEIITNYAYLSAFTLGSLFGAGSVYWFLRMRKKIPMEERFEFADPKDEYRLIMAVRNDLKMQKGKVAAQCGHAAVAAYANAVKLKPRTLGRWYKFGGAKVAVRINSEQELLDLDREAKKLDVLTSVVRDAGHTQVAPGTRTVIAIGPAPRSQLDQITGHLKLF